MSAQSSTRSTGTAHHYRGRERRCEPFSACIESALIRYLKDLNGHRPSGLYEMVLSEIERPLLDIVMRYAKGNQSQAAILLGINRNTLRKKLKTYGIE